MRPIGDPRQATLELAHLVLDENGTLAYRGVLVEGVLATLQALREALAVHFVSADTFGSLVTTAATLEWRRTSWKESKQLARLTKSADAVRVAL